MFYITVKQSPIYHQMTLEELLFQEYSGTAIINSNTTNTRTYETTDISEHFLRKISVDRLIQLLVEFNISTEDLRREEKSSLFRSFHIPKKSGGLRRIDAPKKPLADALIRLKKIFEDDFHAMYHTSAFAYVKGRCTIDAVKRHQKNNSKWFGKLDLHDFFGSTTLDFVMNQLSMVFPFSEVIKDDVGRTQLRMALDLAFLNGGLPQGTQISPLITNIMMIPVDFKLSNDLRNHMTNGNPQTFVYTRYADDFIISSKYDFNVKEIENLIVNTLRTFEAPFTINASKTRYGSSAGRNWNLGVMLNKDNQITVGHKVKHTFQNMIYNYITDKSKGVQWDIGDVQILQGKYSYYRMVEKDNIDNMIQHINEKNEYKCSGFNQRRLEIIRR